MTLSSPNSFSAGTFLNAGEIDLGDNSALGSGTLTISNGTQLAAVVAGRTLANSVSLLGNVMLGGRSGGGIIFNGAVNLNGGVRTITMTSFHQINGVVFNGGIAMAATGGYTLALNASNTYTGDTLLGNNGGILGVYKTGAMESSGTIEFNGNSTLQWNTTGIPDLSSRIKLDDGFTAVFDTVANSITLANPLICGPLGTANLTKIGSGTLTLTAVNTNSGTTTVSAGTLILTGSGALTKLALISVAGGATFNVGPAGMTLTGTQTVSNGASATGIIVSNLIASAGSVSVSYANGTPSLTINSGTNTLAAGMGFKINNNDPALTGGTTNKIISKGTGGFVAGTAPSAVTVNGGGVSGTASLQISNGELYLVVKVISTPPGFPPGGITTLSSGNISLVATGAIGGTYRLWATRNLALSPITNIWTPIVTNTITTSPFTNLDLKATNYTQRFISLPHRELLGLVGWVKRLAASLWVGALPVFIWKLR